MAINPSPIQYPALIPVQESLVQADAIAHGTWASVEGLKALDNLLNQIFAAFKELNADKQATPTVASAPKGFVDPGIKSISDAMSKVGAMMQSSSPTLAQQWAPLFQDAAKFLLQLNDYRYAQQNATASGSSAGSGNTVQNTIPVATQSQPQRAVKTPEQTIPTAQQMTPQPVVKTPDQTTPTTVTGSTGSTGSTAVAPPNTGLSTTAIVALTAGAIAVAFFAYKALNKKRRRR